MVEGEEVEWKCRSAAREKGAKERPAGCVQCAVCISGKLANPGGLRPGQAGQKPEQEGGQSGSERVRSGHAMGGQGKRSKVERAAPHQRRIYVRLEKVAAITGYFTVYLLRSNIP